MSTEEPSRKVDRLPFQPEFGSITDAQANPYLVEPCPTCGRGGMRPPPDTSWIRMETVSDGPGMGAIVGVAFLSLVLILVLLLAVVLT